MKKRLIKTLKNEILVIETPEETYFEVFKHGILFKDHLGAEREFIEGSYTLLGSPDEIKDDDAKELVENKGSYYKNYSPIHGSVQGNVTFTALESFFSAIETVVLWENPYAEPDKFIDGFDNPCYEWWHEAESRTFDKKRVKIFVKN